MAGEFERRQITHASASSHSRAPSFIDEWDKNERKTAQCAPDAKDALGDDEARRRGAPARRTGYGDGYGGPEEAGLANSKTAHEDTTQPPRGDYPGDVGRHDDIV